MVLKRIPIDDNPDVVELIADAYLSALVDGICVHKITINENDVNVKVDLDIAETWGIEGTFQLRLDDDDPLAEKLREIIQLENRTTKEVQYDVEESQDNREDAKRDQSPDS